MHAFFSVLIFRQLKNWITSFCRIRVWSSMSISQTVIIIFVFCIHSNELIVCVWKRTNIWHNLFKFHSILSGFFFHLDWRKKHSTQPLCLWYVFNGCAVSYESMCHMNECIQCKKYKCDCGVLDRSLEMYWCPKNNV